MQRFAVIMLTSTLLLAPEIASTVELDVDLDTRTRLKLSTAKAKLAMQDDGRREVGREGKVPCGTQNIGTVDTDGRRGGPREVIVYVQGPIINSGRGCR